LLNVAGIPEYNSQMLPLHQIVREVFRKLWKQLVCLEDQGPVFRVYLTTLCPLMKLQSI